jgi:energy-coupling factor transporter transmembrane protein EcfT
MLGRILGFFTNLFFNLVLNIGGIVPALILLALHYIFDLSMIWFWIALGVWILGIIIRMLFLSFAMKCSNMPDRHLDNVNPYSAKDIKKLNDSQSDNSEK